MELLGKLFIRGEIELITGLHIGSGRGDMNIGGVDNSVIKLLDGKPYIPGSSIKGKMRSLLEKITGNFHCKVIAMVGQDKKVIKETERIAEINMEKDLKIETNEQNRYLQSSPCECSDCNVCKIFGTGANKSKSPARLYVRDSFLSKKPDPDNEDYTEVKYENTIDRLTSKASNPRQTERVPAGTKFNFEMVFTFYDIDDVVLIKDILKAISLLEDDYLGGSGSRGYGKVKLNISERKLKRKNDYENQLSSGKNLNNLDEAEISSYLDGKQE